MKTQTTQQLTICEPCQVASVNGKRCPACGLPMVPTSRTWAEIYPEDTAAQATERTLT